MQINKNIMSIKDFFLAFLYSVYLNIKGLNKFYVNDSNNIEKINLINI